MLFFAGLMGRTDVGTAGQLLADFERMLESPLVAPSARALATEE
jgi:hypothetical protein